MSISHQRRRLTTEEGSALITAWQRRQGDESRRDFCLRQAIGPWILSYWLKRLALRTPVGFVQVTSVVSAPALEATIGSVRLRICPGFDPVLLRAVVSCLVEVSC